MGLSGVLCSMLATLLAKLVINEGTAPHCRHLVQSSCSNMVRFIHVQWSMTLVKFGKEKADYYQLTSWYMYIRFKGPKSAVWFVLLLGEQ